MAAIINYLIQVTVASDIQNIISGTGDIVTLASSSGIYDALDRKLTVAFSMLSSVPIISFAVLSGSYMGLSKVGERMTGAGQGGMMDASMAERQTFKNAAFLSNASSFTNTFGKGVVGTDVPEPNLSLSASQSSALSDNAARLQQTSDSDSVTRVQSNAVSVGRSMDQSNHAALMKNVQHYMGGEAAHQIQAMEQLAHKYGLNDDQSQKFVAAATTSASLRLGAKGGGGGMAFTAADVAAGMQAIGAKAVAVGGGLEVAGLVADGTVVGAPAGVSLGSAGGVLIAGGMAVQALGGAIGGSPAGTALPMVAGKGKVPAGKGASTPPRKDSKGNIVANGLRSVLTPGAETKGQTTVQGDQTQTIADDMSRTFNTSGGTIDKFSKGWNSAVMATLGSQNTNTNKHGWDKKTTEDFQHASQYSESESKTNSRINQIIQQASVGLTMTPSQITTALDRVGHGEDALNAVRRIGGETQKQYDQLFEKYTSINGYGSAENSKDKAAVMALRNMAVTNNPEGAKAVMEFGQLIATTTGLRIGEGMEKPQDTTGGVVKKIEDAKANIGSQVNGQVEAPGAVSGEVKQKLESPLPPAAKPSTANGQKVAPTVEGREGKKALDLASEAAARAKVEGLRVGANIPRDGVGIHFKNPNIADTGKTPGIVQTAGEGVPSTVANTTKLVGDGAIESVDAIAKAVTGIFE